jgi:hypothetical protein
MKRKPDEKNLTAKQYAEKYKGNYWEFQKSQFGDHRNQKRLAQVRHLKREKHKTDREATKKIINGAEPEDIDYFKSGNNDLKSYQYPKDNSRNKPKYRNVNETTS